MSQLAADSLISLDRSRIKLRSQLIIEEGRRRGFRVVAADYLHQTFRVSRQGIGFTFQKLPGVLRYIQRHGHGACESKPDKKHRLKAAGLRVPRTIASIDREETVSLENLVFPIVVKPIVGTMSTNVAIVRNCEQLLEAVRPIQAGGDSLLPEEYVEGQHFRIIMVDGRFIGAVERRPASVVGDGAHTVAELVTARDAGSYRSEANDLSRTNHRLLVDKTSHQLLTKQGFALNSVPPAGTRCYLQTAITAITGADYVDCTEQVHPNVREDCERFARTIDLLVIGIDYIATDISSPYGAYNEFNLRPYIDLNENNNEGPTRPVSAAVWDHVESHMQRLLTMDMAEF